MIYQENDSGVNGADITNCLLYNNHSTWGKGGAVAVWDYLTSATPNYNFMNCTFASNSCGFQSSSSYYGGGISLRIDSCEPNMNITNSIFWGNLAVLDTDSNDLYFFDSSDNPGYGNTTVSYSDISLPSSFLGSGTSIEVITQDPKFSSFPARNDYPADLMLTSATSLDVTAGGTTEGAPATDYAGDPRTGLYSMGAYEKN